MAMREIVQRFTENWMLWFGIRITSYNVCYTKLLRVYAEVPWHLGEQRRQLPPEEE